MRAWLEVDLDAVAGNYDVVKAHIGSAGIFAVVKSDAYGHGIEAIVRTLDAKGVSGFAVISLEEAFRVRSVCDRPVLILGYLDDDEIRNAIEEGFLLSLYDYSLAKLVSEIAGRVGRMARVHVKVETGLNRLGMSIDEAELLLTRPEDAPHLKVEAIYTHLSTSSSREEDLKQLARFKEIEAKLRELNLPLPMHMTNSGGLNQLPEGFFDFVRIGLALYGVEPVLPGLRPSLQCKTVVIQKKRIRAGEGVSYNKLFIAPEEMDIAVISIGYAEGLSQALTGKVSVIVKGRKVPIIGQICMNLCVIDARGLDVKRGDEVIVVGEHRNADGTREAIYVSELAKAAGLRHHEIIVRFGMALPRMYSSKLIEAAIWPDRSG